MEQQLTEHDERLRALETTGLGKSLTRGQIVTFVALCFVLPAIIAIIGGVVFA